MREAAAKLAAIFPRERLDAAVTAWAEAAPRRGIWGVGFSGGADSLALLLLLWAHWPGRRSRLRVLHFDHRLRGAQSRADARFCRNVCAQLGVDYREGAWTGAHRGASEAEAREARMKFFAREARVVWFGHQQDDIAETMFMRLSRGSGTGGLAAPRPVQVVPGNRVHLRPLLTLKKTELTTALRRLDVAWREDRTNAAPDFFRNRIRTRVIPAWRRAAARDALAGAALSRRLLEEDDAALDAWLLEVLPRQPKRGALDLRALRGKPRALWRRALHRWLLAEPRAGDLSRPAFETLLERAMLGRRTRQSLGAAGFAVLTADVLRFEVTTARHRKS